MEATTFSSPEYVKTSLAGAICAGLESGRFSRDAVCRCLNLLLTYPESCLGACSYCGLACSRDNAAKPTFIRVKWPVYRLEQILERIMPGQKHPFTRICVSLITHPSAVADACTVIRRCQPAGLPVSALVTPTLMDGLPDMQRLKDAGADRVGVAIDAATPGLFDLHRGAGVSGPHQWDRYWQAVDEAVAVFGRFKAGVHLIVGLGETERDMVSVIDRAMQQGALTHLFSFFPEKGSRLAALGQPALDSYRRIQLARYLINQEIITGRAVQYDDSGRIIGYGLDVAPYVRQGTAFMTSGCPGADGRLACNRPFGNERASEPFRNYPFPPEPADILDIQAQLAAADHAGT